MRGCEEGRDQQNGARFAAIPGISFEGLSNEFCPGKFIRNYRVKSPAFGAFGGVRILKNISSGIINFPDKLKPEGGELSSCLGNNE